MKSHSCQSWHTVDDSLLSLFVVDAPQLKAADARQRESEAKLSFDVRRQELLAKQMKEKLDREVGW